MEGIHDGKCLTPYSYIQIFTIKELNLSPKYCIPQQDIPDSY